MDEKSNFSQCLITTTRKFKNTAVTWKIKFLLKQLIRIFLIKVNAINET